MAGRYKVVRAEVSPYNFTVCVARSHKAFPEFDTWSPDLQAVCRGKDAGLTITNGHDVWVIVRDGTRATLVHELCHVMQYVFQTINESLDKGLSEPFAYAFDKLYSDVTSQIKLK